MKSLLIAAGVFVLLSAVAFAAETPKATPAPVPTPPVETSAPTPAPPPSLWHIEGDLDRQDLGTFGSCIGELPKKIADPFAAKINGMLKIVK